MYSDLRSGQRDDHWLHRKLCEGRFLFRTVTANSRSTHVTVSGWQNPNELAIAIFELGRVNTISI
jgi:hypothetical protein